ncbi:cupin [filamentous cyanobacterium CCT1]|nr:cupin [filamentous cyanobacterium CCT1]PSN77680.1 cupin [filamentous cyanobacterium CCP4]
MPHPTSTGPSASTTNHSSPTLTYWHVWSDDAGISHQTQCELADFEQSSIAEGTDPQWNNRLLTVGTNIMFTVLPVGWVGEWHENPQPQWIVPLSGCWFVETMDGQRVEMGPGDVSFGGDQQTKPNAEGHKGHLSGTVGDEPAVLMIAQINDEQWIAARPGAFS